MLEDPNENYFSIMEEIVGIEGGWQSNFPIRHCEPLGFLSPKRFQPCVMCQNETSYKAVVANIWFHMCTVEERECFARFSVLVLLGFAV